MDKLYKAFVRDKETRRCSELVMEYSSKKEFIEDIHGNGYTIYRNHIKEADLYDWIDDRTAYIDDEDEYAAYWKFTEIPKDRQEEKEMFQKHFDQVKNKKIYNYVYNRRRAR